ncbi:MAG: hypothetical protein ACJAQ6_002049 [Arenicella sp.]|jgi:hypothetical protein
MVAAKSGSKALSNDVAAANMSSKPITSTMPIKANAQSVYRGLKLCTGFSIEAPYIDEKNKPNENILAAAIANPARTSSRS